VQKQQRNELIVGLIFFGGMIILGAYTILISGVFKGATKTYWVSFPNIYGLKKGDTVRVEGLEVGEVTDLHLIGEKPGEEPRGDLQRIKAKLKVKKEVEIFKDGSEVKVTPFSPLGGRIVEIRRGYDSPRGKFASEEETGADKAEVIIGVAEGELLTTLNNLVAENRPGIARIVSNLAFVSTRLTQTNNVIGALINDPGTGSLLVDMANDLARSANSINLILERIEKGQGVVGELVAKRSDLHDNLNSAVKNLNGVFSQADQMLATANRGESALGVFVSEDPRVSADARAIVRDIAIVTSDVAAGRGSLGKFIRDDRFYDGAAATAENLAVITSNVTTGESAVGVLFNDVGTGTAIKSTLSHLDSIAQAVDEGKGAFGLVVRDQAFRDRVARIFTEVERLTVEFRDSVEDLREQAPINAFLGVVFAAF
jgi:ABC-type transporter Mla subunit MlaD